MEAQEVRYNSIIDRLGENNQFVFSFNFPINTTWEMVHASLANMANAAKELEENQKVKESPKIDHPDVIQPDQVQDITQA